MVVVVVVVVVDVCEFGFVCDLRIGVVDEPSTIESRILRRVEMLRFQKQALILASYATPPQMLDVMLAFQ